MSESGTAAGEPGPALLAVEGVTKEFGLRRTVAERIARTRAESHRAVDDVSFSLRKGEILGLAGGSGSGKTTLARCLIRLVEPGAGSALDGIDARAARGSAARAAPPDAWSSRIPTRR